MTELEKFKAVNACETIDELKACIISFADDKGLIQGRTEKFDAKKMSDYVSVVVKGYVPPNVLTREFGIRQQALYLAYMTNL